MGGVPTPSDSLHWKLTLGGKSLATLGNWTCLSSVSAQCSTTMSYIPTPKEWAKSPPSKNVLWNGGHLPLLGSAVIQPSFVHDCMCWLPSSLLVLKSIICEEHLEFQTYGLGAQMLLSWLSIRFCMLLMLVRHLSYGKGFFSHSQPSVQTLSWCSYSPCV